MDPLFSSPKQRASYKGEWIWLKPESSTSRFTLHGLWGQKLAKKLSFGKLKKSGLIYETTAVNLF
jgi:hypothetical protein